MGQRSINSRMDKLWHNHLMDYCISVKNEWTAETGMNRDEPRTKCKQKNSKLKNVVVGFHTNEVQNRQQWTLSHLGVFIYVVRL